MLKRKEKNNIFLFLLIISFFNCTNSNRSNSNFTYSKNKYLQIKKFDPKQDIYFLEYSKINYLDFFLENETYIIEIDDKKINTFEDTILLIDEILMLKNDTNYYYRTEHDFYPLPGMYDSYVITTDVNEDLITNNLMVLLLLERFLNLNIYNAEAYLLPILRSKNLSNYSKKEIIDIAYNSLKNFKNKVIINKKISSESILSSSDLYFKEGIKPTIPIP
jgi:hypothetical protein